MPQQDQENKRSVFNNSKESKKMHHKVKKVGNNQNQNEAIKEYLNTAMSFCMTLFSGLQTILTPILGSLKDKCEKHVSIDLGMFARNFQCVFIVIEVLIIMFHSSFMVRMWVLMNLSCAFLFMYNELSDKSVKNRLLPIRETDIKTISSTAIASGMCIVLFFTTTLGFFSLPSVLFAMNRTWSRFSN